MITIAEDYTEIVAASGLAFKTDTSSISIGQPRKPQGWVMHLSVIPAQMAPLLKAVLPVILKFGVPCKVIRSKGHLKDLNGGVYGLFKIGKAITLYLDDEDLIADFTEEILIQTKGFTGPRVSTDFFLGNNVFVRYGSFISHIVTDPFGNRMRMLRNAAGSLIPDWYHIPPIIPPSVSNPFVPFFLRLPRPPKLNLVGNRYLPLKLLKSDPKGNVYKGLYFNQYIVPKRCVIKEGEKGMFPDELGRDMRERLQWQFQVHSKLYPLLPVPRPFEYIQDDGQAYLIVSYIKNGKSLLQVISEHLHNTAWFAQSEKLRRKLLNLLLQVIGQIRLLHHRGYIHRDITSSNFIVARGKVHLIDLELIYSFLEREPDPPFGVGTFGYVSPGQVREEKPVIQDDIYSLGALMLATVTGIEPIYFKEMPLEGVCSFLYMVTRDTLFSRLICQCLSPEPAKRPSLYTIEQQINRCLGHTKGIQSQIHSSECSRELVRETIEMGIEALGSDLMTAGGLWYSRVENRQGRDVYPLGDKHVFTGLYRGIGGVIYTLARLQKAGFDIEPAITNLQINLDFLLDDIETRLPEMAPSLYYGKAGIALTLAEAIRAGFIPDEPKTRSVIRRCFSEPAETPDILFGIAGQGLGLMQCKEFMEKGEGNHLLNEYVQILINSQLKDGSWLKTPTIRTDRKKVTGFGYGIAGVVYFLLEYGDRHSDDAALKAAERGLNYLGRHTIKRRGYLNWPQNNKSNSMGSWWCKGGPGIAVAYLKGYELTKEETYEYLATQALYLHPRYLVTTRLSQCHGLSGLGEIYLEAYQTTNNHDWWERATWIAEYLVHFKGEPRPNTATWLVDHHDFPTADLMLGHSGILHLLAKFYTHSKLGFPVISPLRIT